MITWAIYQFKYYICSTHVHRVSKNNPFDYVAYQRMSSLVCRSNPGCLQLLEISCNLKTLLEISWNLNGPPGNFCIMIIVWLMALLHDDVALFVH